jgi:V/A-type H+-transporting ATPase subunit I
MLAENGQYEAALGILRSYKIRADARRGEALPRPGNADGDGTLGNDAIVKNILDLSSEKKTLQDQISAIAREKSRIEMWGDFSPASFKGLAERGIKLTPYQIPLSVYEKLIAPVAEPGIEPVEILTLYKDKNIARVLVVDGTIQGEMPFILPEASLGELINKETAITSRLIEIENALQALAPEAKTLAAEVKRLDGEIEFETARLTVNVETGSGAGTVAWLQGFAPYNTVGQLKRAAAENGWALAIDDPAEDDAVPTLLKNNRFVGLLDPVLNFLDITPGYNEPDISAPFLVFFTLFFAMIFGDAGYGGLLLLAGLAGALITKKKMGKVAQPVCLLLLLAFTNFAWGIITCTWFGVETKYLPEILKTISLQYPPFAISNSFKELSDANSTIVQQNMMIVCFGIGLLQLGIAHIINISRTRSLKILGDVGSIMMLVGMFDVIRCLVVVNTGFGGVVADAWPLYSLGVGFVLNFVFADYNGSIGGAIMESVKNIISKILGVANVFGDIMSYIRLWAVGLAGAAISSTVDTMAGPMLGSLVTFIFAVILLVFGHGLNMVLNVLSVVVHGVRLNTLEFSQHANVGWSGFKYKPFAVVK